MNVSVRVCVLWVCIYTYTYNRMSFNAVSLYKYVRMCLPTTRSCNTSLDQCVCIPRPRIVQHSLVGKVYYAPQLHYCIIYTAQYRPIDDPCTPAALTEATGPAGQGPLRKSQAYSADPAIARRPAMSPDVSKASARASQRGTQRPQAGSAAAPKAPGHSRARECECRRRACSRHTQTPGTRRHVTWNCT